MNNTTGGINNPPPAPVVKSEPTKAAVKGTYGGHGGRKFVKEKAENKIPDGPVPKKRKQPPATMEELDKILDNDALALLGMKKDIDEAQRLEVIKSQKLLLDMQKECDALKIENDIKEKRVASVSDQTITLNHLSSTAKTTTVSAKNDIDSMASVLGGIEEELAAEQRTNKMLILMFKRSQDEINDCKIECSKAQFQLDALKHDSFGVESSLRLSRQELIIQDRQMDFLTKTSKSRKQDRDDKIDELHTLVRNGEESVNMVKQMNATNLNSSFPAKLPSAVPDKNQTVLESASVPHTPFQAVHGRRSPSGVHSAQSDGIHPEEDELQRQLPTLAKSNSMVNFDQIKEIVERYKTKNIRFEKLKLASVELKEEVISMTKKNKELSEQLQRTVAKRNVLASNRQMYHEIDMKDVALATARKECEECRIKEYRLRVSIESLKRSFPRFLTKVTHVVHPIPTVEQLADAVHKLGDEVTKLIKLIGAMIVKDVTPDDLSASIANGGAAISSSAANSKEANNNNGTYSSTHDVNSEIGRIRKLPGYARLQRQLFVNLMCAAPDATAKNVRIDVVDGKQQFYQQHQQAKSNANLSNGGDAQSGNGPTTLTANSTISYISTGNNQQPLDRATVKNISRLIIDRDAGGVRPPNGAKGEISDVRRRRIIAHS